MMKNKILSSTILVLISSGMSTTVYAKAEWAAQFRVGCESCHTSPGGTGGNVKSTAQAAYNAGGLNGLQTFLSSNSGGGVPAPKNKKPVISPIALQWDVEAGQALSIPLSVHDKEQDDVKIIGNLPTDSKLSSEYIGSTNLPTFDFEWTPTANQANKIYTVNFKAQQTATNPKITSLPVKAKIRVWPAGNREKTYIKSLIVSKSKWTNGKLNLKGKIVLNKIMTASEKTAFLQSGLNVNITEGLDGLGAVISNSLPFSTIDAKGNWTITNIDLPETPAFSCNVTVDLEDTKASRLITGAPASCIK